MTGNPQQTRNNMAEADADIYYSPATVENPALMADFNMTYQPGMKGGTMREEMENIDVNYYVPDFTELESFASDKDMHFWLNEWRNMVSNNAPIEKIEEWFENIKRLHGPHIIGNRSCIGQLTLYTAKRQRLPVMGEIVSCGGNTEECSK